jgi:GTP-binding protein HflX
VIEHKQIVENERAVLVGLIHRFQTETQLQEYLHELAFLAETAGAVTEKVFFSKITQA